jgi:outer membrane protein assembly factor BamB
LVATQHAVFALSRTGRPLSRRVDLGNICVSAEHDSIVSTPGRLVSFLGHEKNARWFRSYDGPPLTGTLHETSYGWVCSLAHRGVASFSKLSGSEQWRVEPSRTQHSHLVVHADRIFLATDTGTLIGIDAENGATRYRIRTSLPFTLPPVVHGQTLVAILSRGERTAVIAASATNGVLQWSRELSLEQPAAPTFLRGRVWVAGHKRGKACLVSLSRSGEVLWERNLPLEGSHLHVIAWGHGAVVQDSRGGAAMVSVDGQIDWILGTGAAYIPHTIAPINERGDLHLSVENDRAVEPQTGRVLAHIKVGPALTALATDRNLNLYMLMENGLLRAMKLGAQLSVL